MKTGERRTGRTGLRIAAVLAAAAVTVQSAPLSAWAEETAAGAMTENPQTGGETLVWEPIPEEAAAGADSAEPTEDSGADMRAAEEEFGPVPEGALHIRDESDFLAFAENCRLDRYSDGLTVVLDSDIALEAESWPVASFGGTFDGRGHTISGFTQTGPQGYTGLFSTVRQTGTVRNLRVIVQIEPSGIQTRLGGIAGTNYGRIENCAVSGRISAHAEAGGIAGRNMQSGEIRSCVFEGTVQGDVYTGGIAGYNEGVIISCANRGLVNTEYQDVPHTAEQVSSTLENILLTGKLNTPENTDVRMDTGGIAGISSGIITSCSNERVVGYDYVGYNTGGIVGRSSGFIRDCVNTGKVLGRKDVGGIAGQLQPFLQLDFTGSVLGELDEALDTLQSRVGSALNSASGYSADTNARLSTLSVLAGTARDDVRQLSDEAADTADSAAARANSASSVLQDAFGILSGVVSQVTAYTAEVKEKADRFGKALDAFMDEAQLTESERAELKAAFQRFSGGLDQVSSSAQKLGELIASGPEIPADSREAVNEAYRGIKDGYSEMEDAAAEITGLLEAKGLSPAAGADAMDYSFFRDAEAVRAAAEEMNRAIAEKSGPLAPVGERTGNDAQESGQAGESAGDEPGTGELTGVIAAVEAAQRLIDGIVSGEGEKPSLRGEMEEFFQSRSDAGDPLSEEDKAQISGDVARIEAASKAVDEDLETLKEIRDRGLQDEDAVRAWEDEVIPVLSDLTGQLGGIAEAYRDLNSVVSGYAGRFPGGQLPGIGEAFGELAAKASAFPAIGNDLAGVLDSLAGLDLRLSGVSAQAREAGNELYDTLGGMLNEVNGLNNSIHADTSAAIGDLRGITDQFSVIFDILEKLARQQLGSDEDGDDEDSRFEDVSEEEIGKASQGRTSECVNEGEISADSHAGGIAGTIGIEYDLDPEQDIQTMGKGSLNYIFRARGIIDRSENRGRILSRGSYCGGIAGNMEMGVISECINRGEVVCRGDYAGGIAGFSAASIRNSSERSDVSGVRYVGGIAGYGTRIAGTAAMVNITGAEQFSGAVAGWVKDLDFESLNSNIYYSDTAYGINGVSYTGMAEPVAYARLREESQGAELFTDLELDFTVDGEAVSTLWCRYGDSIPEESIPPVPERTGFIGRWSRSDYSYITKNEVIIAEYTRIVTMISSGERRQGGMPVLLAEGSFDEGEEIALYGELTEAGELERWHAVIPEEVPDKVRTEPEEEGGENETGGASHRLRFLPGGDWGEFSVCIFEDGVKTPVELTRNGRYYCFESPLAQFSFTVEPAERKKGKPGAAAAGTCLAAAAVLYFRKRGRRGNH